MSGLPWQLRLNSLFSALNPADVQRRDTYWHDGDYGVQDVDGNNILRFRSYVSDGHSYRQEAVLAAGESVGLVMRGNDRVGDVASLVTYSDVIVQVAQALNFKIPDGGLLWNSVPFNPALNPTSTMPPGLALAEDVFAIAQASIPGASSLDEAQATIASIQATAGDLTVDGNADFSSPFAAYCTLFPTKLPLLNFGSIMFLQCLFKGLPLFLTSTPGAPIILSPLGLSISALCKMTTETAYLPSIEGTVIGQELQQVLLESVPGIGAAFES